MAESGAPGGLPAAPLFGSSCEDGEAERAVHPEMRWLTGARKTGCRWLRKILAVQSELVMSVGTAERLGSGDGEREASMTRQMPYEPLPASVLFALVSAE